jgi:hypothetical protein
VSDGGCCDSAYSSSDASELELEKPPPVSSSDSDSESRAITAVVVEAEVGATARTGALESKRSQMLSQGIHCSRGSIAGRSRRHCSALTSRLRSPETGRGSGSAKRTRKLCARARTMTPSYQKPHCGGQRTLGLNVLRISSSGPATTGVPGCSRAAASASLSNGWLRGRRWVRRFGTTLSPTSNTQRTATLARGSSPGARKYLIASTSHQLPSSASGRASSGHRGALQPACASSSTARSAIATGPSPPAACAGTPTLSLHRSASPHGTEACNVTYGRRREVAAGAGGARRPGGRTPLAPTLLQFYLRVFRNSSRVCIRPQGAI